MRTTLTIDDETDSSLRRISRKQGITYKDVVNRALLEGLKALEAREAPVRFEVLAKDYGFQPGVDQEKLNQLVDDLESGA